MTKSLCLHHNDADGRASAAIARRALGKDLALYEMNYGDPIPWEMVEAATQVIVVDFSLPLEAMQRIAASRELVWIDHHKSSLETLQAAAVEWPGLRDIAEAGCVLTWRYYFPDQPVPRAVILIGDRDIWRWAEADTGPFGEGLFQLDTCPDNDELWQPLLNDDPHAVAQLIETGAILREARLQGIRRKTASAGFEVTFEGHRTLAVNERGSGDMGQHIRDIGYTIAYCYIDKLLDGTLTTFVTLYSAEVDVSEIARKFGGGGHRGAAGFSFERGPTPFPPQAQVAF
ncbi:MAG: hypothetical protein OEZ02_01250 [Anaerolineae bacterium]|nr:hypothetical protein [Anaerolineae bacterium]